VAYIGTGASGGIKYIKSGYVGFGRFGTCMVFGGETAELAASAAVASGIQGMRVRLGDGRGGLRAAVKYVVYIIFRVLVARLCRIGGGGSARQRSDEIKI